MTKAQSTKDLLHAAARQMFWSRGYSNVSLRDIARAAQVDVALVSRYFGSKMGLFEATLSSLDALDPSEFATPQDLINWIVDIFTSAPRGPQEVSPVDMILMNARDPEVGPRVVEVQKTCWQEPLEQIIGDKTRAALFLGAMMGFSIGEKSLHLEGISAPGTPEFEAELRHVLNAALTYPTG